MRSFPEVRGINKQKFLTELGRLLTFMYDDDRERALDMYSSLFDETDDETGLLQMLGSPTRQAVNLARSYDARERKLQMQAQSRGEATGEDEPAYVRITAERAAEIRGESLADFAAQTTKNACEIYGLKVGE